MKQLVVILSCGEKAKHDKEVYTKIVLEAGLDGETENDLDVRA